MLPLRSIPALLVATLVVAAPTTIAQLDRPQPDDATDPDPVRAWSNTSTGPLQTAYAAAEADGGLDHVNATGEADVTAGATTGHEGADSVVQELSPSTLEPLWAQKAESHTYAQAGTPTGLDG